MKTLWLYLNIWEKWHTCISQGYIWCAGNYIILDLLVALNRWPLKGRIPKCSTLALRTVQLGWPTLTVDLAHGSEGRILQRCPFIQGYEWNSNSLLKYKIIEKRNGWLERGRGVRNLNNKADVYKHLKLNIADIYSIKF